MTDRKQMKESPFSWIKISNYGTSNPIVARTSYQSQQLLNLYAFDKEFEKERSKVMWEIQQRLVACYDMSSSMIKEIESSKLTFKEKAKNDPSFHPWIMNIDTRLESFLQSAKLGLRDIGGILKLFFGEDFGHYYHKALEWAEKQFTNIDPLTKTIRKHSAWIAEIIDMRNAVEHPADRTRGRLHIENFRLNRGNSKIKLNEPVWWLTNEQASLVANDLPAIVDCLLRLSEELYVTALIKQDTPIAVMIEEIPEKQRDKSAPVRFRATDSGCLAE